MKEVYIWLVVVQILHSILLITGLFRFFGILHDVLTWWILLVKVYNCNSSGNRKFLDAHSGGSIAVNGSRRDFNLGIDVSFVDPFTKSYENFSPNEVLVSKEKLKQLKY